MKKTSIALGIMISSMFLMSCSTNTQKENTGIGAVSGAVIGGLAGSLVGGGTGQAIAIGVGAIGGALLGGYIGHNMDSSDNSQMYVALEGKTGKPTYWTNPKTGVMYTVTPTSGMMNINGNPNCRKFSTVANVNGKKQKVYGTACRQADGKWVSINP